MPMRRNVDLTRGLIFAYTPSIAQPFDRVGGNLGVITNVARVNIRRTLGMRFAGGADLNSVINYGTQASTENLANSPATWAFYCATTDLTRLDLACHEDNNVAGGWQIGPNQMGPIGLNITRAVVNLKFGATLAGFDTGGAFTVVVTHDGSLTQAGCRIYANGVVQSPAAGADGSGASASVPAESFFLGRGRLSANNNLDGDIYACAIAKRVWSAAEAAAYHADPYAIFGRPRWAATSGPPIVGNALFFGAGSIQ